MSSKKIAAKMLNFTHIGILASFESGGAVQHGEIRQIHHSAEFTCIWMAAADYYRVENYYFPEYVLGHDDVIQLGEANG